MERIGLEVPTVVLAPKLGRPRLVIGAQLRHAHGLSRSKDPGLGQGANGSMAHALQDILGRRVRANRPRLWLVLLCGDPTRAHVVANLLGLEAHPRHRCPIMVQPAQQRMHAFNLQ